MVASSQHALALKVVAESSQSSNFILINLSILSPSILKIKYDMTKMKYVKLVD